MELTQATESPHIVFGIFEIETNTLLMLKIEPEVFMGKNKEDYIRNNLRLRGYVNSIGGYDKVHRRVLYRFPTPEPAIKAYNETIEDLEPEFGGEIIDPVNYLFEYGLVAESDELNFESVNVIQDFNTSNTLIIHDTGREFRSVLYSCKFSGICPSKLANLFGSNAVKHQSEWSLKKLKPYQMAEYRDYECKISSRFPTIKWRNLKKKDYILEIITTLSPLKTATYADALELYNQMMKR